MAKTMGAVMGNNMEEEIILETEGWLCGGFGGQITLTSA